MRELVIIITDLYLAGAPEPAGASAAMPALEHIARFAHQRGPQSDWRAWVARWLGLTQYAQLPPASIAAAGQPVPGETVWFASPLHLIAGVGRVHLRRSGRLCLAPQTLARLAADFNSTFAGSGFALAPLASGEFLLGAPRGLSARTCDPARVPQAGLLEALPLGEGAAVLRRLGAEIEMWLHAHPLNRERAHRGERPVSTLWIWGGGEPPAMGTASRPAPVTVFACEAYVRGLCRLAGLEIRPVAQMSALSEAGTPGTLCVLELAEVLQRQGGSSLPEALAEIDRRVIAPALAALHQRRFDRLVLLANDRQWTLRFADRLRIWRRRRAGLEALQA